MRFNYNRNFKTMNFRKHPELYQIGVGEQGVLLVEPYKSEILPLWKFRTEKIALQSARAIFKLFKQYRAENDFVGMDMARKFLQMGFTRARRYANHASGTKYKKNTTSEKKLSKVAQNKVPQTKKRVEKRAQLPQEKDWRTNEKARAGEVFYTYYEKAKEDAKYLKLKAAHRMAYENQTSKSRIQKTKKLKK